MNGKFVRIYPVPTAMAKIIKCYFGVFLAVFMAFQGIAVQSTLSTKYADKIADTDNLTVSGSSIEKFADGLSIISEGERLIFSGPKNHIPGEYSFPFSISDYLIHFENEIKKQISLHHRVDLFFGIRELKFPTHFFW